MKAETRSHVDLAFLRTGNLTETPAGALFLPVDDRGDRFLAGRLGPYPVLVVLDGNKPFHVSAPEEWSRGAGLIVPKIRFQADPSSASECQGADDASHGSLVLSDLGSMIIAFDHNGKKAVLLSDGDGDTDINGKNSVAFKAWRIVTDEGSPVVLYESPLGPM